MQTNRPVSFGGFFSFRYPRGEQVDEKPLKKFGDELKIRDVGGDPIRAQGEFHLDSYVSQQLGPSYACVDLSTSELADRDQVFVHRMLLKIAEAFGEDVLADVRDTLHRHAEKGDSYKQWPASFSAKAQPQPPGGPVDD